MKTFYLALVLIFFSGEVLSKGRLPPRSHVAPLNKKPLRYYLGSNIVSAVQSGNLKKVKELIELGESVDTVERFFTKPYYQTVPTITQIAVLHRHKNILNLLIKEGADVNKTSTEGAAPLHTAITLNYVEGALILIKFKKTNINQRSALGSPLTIAFRYKRYKILEALTKREDLNITENTHLEESPLFTAVRFFHEHKNMDLIKRLLPPKDLVNYSHRNKEGLSIMDFARSLELSRKEKDPNDKTYEKLLSFLEKQNASGKYIF